MAQTPLPNPIPIVISGPSPWIDVKAYGAVGDGSANDHDSIQHAIDACPPNGCTIYFGSNGTSSRYKINSGLTITTKGVKLLGECGTLATVGSQTCSHLISNQQIVMLTVGSDVNGDAFDSGLVIQDLGFQDSSDTKDQVTGALRLLKLQNFSLTNVHCQDITTGYCFQFDGGSLGPTEKDFTQFGVPISPFVVNVKFPIQTKSQASEINLYGGNLHCNDIPDSIGMDLGKSNPASSTGGEWAPSKLLSYQATGTPIQGNPTQIQGVYSFSIPSIKPGSGIRARVFWQCTTSSGGNKTFSWQFGNTAATYAAYNTSVNNLTYAEVRIFNNPNSQSQQTMFTDPILQGTTLLSAGTVVAPGETTSGPVTLNFRFNPSPASEIITPKGFIVEAIQ